MKTSTHQALATTVIQIGFFDVQWWESLWRTFYPFAHPDMGLEIYLWCADR